MEIKVDLTSKELLDKKFKNCPRGYDPLEVDEFLDKIIKDYLLIEKNCLSDSDEIKIFNEKVEKLDKQIKDLIVENEKLKNSLTGIQNNGNVSVDNINLLKRIDSLEKFLWKHGFNPSIIK